MSILILMPSPEPVKPKPTPHHDQLMFQNAAFETLLIGLRKLPPCLHRAFLIHALTLMFDAPNLVLLPTVVLAELMFWMLDGIADARGALKAQNLMLYALQSLEGMKTPPESD